MSSKQQGLVWIYGPELVGLCRNERVDSLASMAPITGKLTMGRTGVMQAK